MSAPRVGLAAGPVLDPVMSLVPGLVPGLVLGLVLGLVPALTTPAAGQEAPADRPGLSVTVDPPTVGAGERVTVEIVLAAPPDALAGEPRFPVWESGEGAAWGGAEIVDASPPERLEGTWRQRLVLTAFRTGRVRLPPRTVAVPGPRTTDQLSTPADLGFRVASVFPEGTDPADAEPAPPAPPRPLPLGRPFWWTLAVSTLLAVAALGTVLLGRRSPSREARGEATPPLPPARELEDALDAVGEPVETGHERLSAALRRYLGRRLGFPAVESTTTEIRDRLRRGRVPGGVAVAAGRVLAACDGVKFAARPSTAEELAARVERTRELCRTLEAHLTPADTDRRQAA